MKKTYLEWEQVLEKLKTLPISKEDVVFGVPKNGMLLAGFLPAILGCKLTHKAEEASVIFDDLIDSGRTRDRFKELYPNKFFIAAFDKQIRKDLGWIVFPWEDEKKDKEEVITRLLEQIGEDPTREGLLETPKRVVEMHKEVFGGYSQKPEDILKVFEDGACDEMVLLKDIEFYSYCEHHMVPFTGKAHIAYIPNGKVIGVSKLARLLDIYARRLQIQERLGQQVVSALMEHLQPLGAACIIEAQHLCMKSRGVKKQSSVMVTSAMRGIFREDSAARSELMSLIKG